MSYPVKVCSSWKTLRIYLLYIRLTVISHIGWRGEGNIFLYECGNLSLADRNLKTLRESPRGTVSASGEFGLLQMVLELDTGLCVSKVVEPQTGWTPDGVLARTLDPKGGGLGGPTPIGEGNECQRGCWTSKGGGLWDPTSVEEGNEAFFIRVWKPLPNRPVLKTLREVRKEKTQKGQYLLAVDLGCYINVSRELYICRSSSLYQIFSFQPSTISSRPTLSNQ